MAANVESTELGGTSMKLLMIIVDSSCREELEVLLGHQGVAAYTEIPGAHGVGTSGVRMGSRAHPKTSSVFFTVLEGDQITTIRDEIGAYCDACGKHMKMIVWGVEELV